MASGYKSTEFWMKIIAASAIAGLGAFNVSEANLPPVAQGILAIVCPLLLAWLSAKYGDNRTKLKLADAAGEKAAESVTDTNRAIEVLRGQ